jgi:NADH dehydrogenase
MAATENGTSAKGTVLLIGGTGYVGDVMRNRMRDAGYTVRLLTRSSSNTSRYESEGFETVGGDVTDTNSIVRALDGADMVVNLVAVIKEKGDATFERMNHQGSVNVADAARQTGVTRLVQMSALGAGNMPDYPYHFNKWRAENYIKDLGLEYTIFRPSIIFGPGDKEQFVGQLADVVKMAPVIPVIGDGKSKFQPIHLNDVSDSFIKALDDRSTIDQTYELGGPDKMTYEDILDEIARTLGKNKRKIHMSPALMQIVVSIMTPLPVIEPPVTNQQLKMLKLDNTTDHNAAPDLVGQALTPLKGNIGYIKR